jgi:hypothetical protein
MIREIRGGPKCGRCGCNDTEVTRRFSRWGAPWERIFCRNCGYSWPQKRKRDEKAPKSGAKPEGTGDAAVFERFKPTKCTKCGSLATRTYRTMRPIRYHTCSDCDARFKSVELS